MLHGHEANVLAPFVLPLLFLALLIRRNLRPRPLKIERLWVLPALILLIGAGSLAGSPPASLWGWVAIVTGVGLGALAGWWRGRLTLLMVDPDTHLVTSKASVLGLVLIAGLFAARYALKIYMSPEGGGGAHPALGAGAVALTSGVLAFGVSAMAAQRLEMWLRGRRMLAEAISARRARGFS